MTAVRLGCALAGRLSGRETGSLELHEFGSGYQKPRCASANRRQAGSYTLVKGANSSTSNMDAYLYVALVPLTEGALRYLLTCPEPLTAGRHSSLGLTPIRGKPL